jgi:hypothetical protein
MMSSKLYFLTFEGYWRETEISTIPNNSGVYCVYTCRHQSERNLVSIRSLIYIKGAEDVGASIANAENLSVWRKHLREGEELCFSLAPVEPQELPRVEAGLIFHHKPPQDSEYQDSFPFEPTTVINTSGRNYQLDELCVVHKTLPETSPSATTTTEQTADRAPQKTES